MMKQILFRFLIALLFALSLPAGLKGQEITEVTRSSETMVEKGTTFYLHKVEKGQTLYRIARTYNVSIGDILRYNPDASEGLQQGQTLKIPSSGPVVETKSDNFIFHIVRKGETLRAIANIYGTREEDIRAINGGGLDKLAVEQVIKIPMDYSGIYGTKPDTTQPVATEPEFVQYEVAEKETLYSIARKYNVTIADLIEWNPELKSGLKKGQIIRIGKPVVRPRDNGMLEYRVQKKESLYGIARKNRISIDSLKLFNPGLTERVNEGQIILIPRKGASSYITHQTAGRESLKNIAGHYQVDEEALKKANPGIGRKTGKDEPVKIPVEPVPVTETSEEALAEVTETPDDEICGQAYNFLHEEFSVALILPLNLSQVNNIPATPSRNQKDKDIPSFKYLSFYEGALMALDSLKKKGLKARFYVYDNGHDLESTREMLRRPEMKGMDLLICLSFSKNFDLIADFAKNNRIPVVNAISRRDEILRNNEFVIKPYPSSEYQADVVSKFLKSRPVKQNIVLLRNNKIQHTQLANQLRTKIQESIGEGTLPNGSRFRFLDDTVSKVNASLKPGYQNFLLVLSDNEAFNINLLRTLSNRNDTLRFSLIGLPAWEEMRNLETASITNANIHFVSPYFADYADPATRNFISGYRANYLAEPDELAFAGFDLTWFFMNALMMNGHRITDCITNLQMKSILSKYRYSRQQPNGLVNTFWNIYQYSGYRPVLMNR